MLATNKLEFYLRYKAMVKFPLTVAGLYPVEEPEWWYRLLPYAQFVGSSITVMAIVNYLVHHISDLNVIIKVIGFLTSTSLYTIKLFVFTANRKELAILHADLNGHCNEVMKDSRLIVPACERISECFRLSVLFCINCWGSFFVILVILPFVFTTIQNLMDPTNAKYTLIYPTLYPWNTSSDGIVYRATYLLESLAAFGLVLVSTGVDCLILFYIFQITCQLRAMSYRLHHLREDENYDDMMKVCVMHYATTIEWRDELQRIYGPIIFFNVGSCAALLCTLMYQLSQATGLTKIHILRVALYIMAKLFQNYQYTWSGTLLLEESEKFLRDIYLSQWLETRSIRSVLITISQRPLVVVACDVLVSSVETFHKVINTTISYFLLLRTLA